MCLVAHRGESSTLGGTALGQKTHPHQRGLAVFLQLLLLVELSMGQTQCPELFWGWRSLWGGSAQRRWLQVTGSG